MSTKEQDCPVRFRCVGCAHFSTDISYLPDLETHLADLLRNRERLLATVEVDDWAKAEAMSTDAEISRVRRLIARVKADLDGLTDTERSQSEYAITIVRRNRRTVTALEMPRARQPLPTSDRSAPQEQRDDPRPASRLGTPVQADQSGWSNGGEAPLP